MTKKSKTYTYKSSGSLAHHPTVQSLVLYQEFKGAAKLGMYEDDSFAITLIAEGHGTHTINSTVYPVKPRQVHLQFPEQKQRWKLKAGAFGQRLIIRKILAETFSNIMQFTFSPYNQHPVLEPDGPTYKKLLGEFLAIKKELGGEKIFFELVNARCRLISLIINLWLEDKFGDALPSPSGSIAYKFHSLIEKHYRTQKTVSFYAKHLCITPNYLGVICKKQYKMSALEFIQERILLEAKRLLHSSDRSIKEVAFHLGFKSLPYFSFFFKSKTGLTPKEYKELLEKY